MTFPSGQGFQNPPVGNQGTLVRPAIKSPNYVTGSNGWSINRDGSAEFNNVIVRGLFQLPGDYASRAQDLLTEPSYATASVWAPVSGTGAGSWNSCIFKTFTGNANVDMELEGYANASASSTLRVAYRIYSGPTINGPWTLEYDFNQADSAMVGCPVTGSTAGTVGHWSSVANGLLTSDIVNRPWIQVMPGFRVSNNAAGTNKMVRARICVTPGQ